MRKNTALSLLVCSLLLLSAASVPQAAVVEPGNAIFCKGLSDKWEPVEPGAEFDSNVVSCLFRGKKAFGVMQVVLSIYLVDEKGQTLLHREQGDINPTWNSLYLADIPLPKIGNYAFVLSSASGEVFSSGEVIIKEKTVEKPIPEKNKVDGTTLEDLFNKFKDQVKK